MWSYYGAKTNIIHLYPKPKHDLIIEPFAGSARYALRYFEKDIILIDKYKVIADIWKWLQKCSPNDILKLPISKAGDNINTIKFDCDEARLFYGFCIGFGFHHPRQIATVRLRYRPNHLPLRLKKVADQLYKIKHWKIIEGDYFDIDNKKATWFIDPPYKLGGHVYACSSKKIDFNLLSAWCMSRNGQIIVCESSIADWLKFIPLVTQNVRSGKYSEVIWSNETTAYDMQQAKLF